MEQVREKIKEVLAKAKAPILLCSFGKDSLLLLHLIREIRDIPLLWFRGDLTSTQRQFAENIIKEFDLTVFGYPPASARLVSNFTLVREYDINGKRLPVLLDFAESENCPHVSSAKWLSHFKYPWDVSFVGWKRTDSHPLVSGVDLDGFEFGGTTFVSPLRDFTDSDVWSAIHQLNVSYDQARYDEQNVEHDPDLILACADCLGRAGMLREAA